MTKRWMKSVITASKQDVTAMPFERYARCSTRKASEETLRQQA